jgi:hypothetical protein
MSGDQLPKPDSGDFMELGDAPHLSIERLTAQLVDQAGHILSAQHHLHRLLDANRTIVSELSLPAVLRQIVQSARETAGAQYAALGSSDPMVYSRSSSMWVWTTPPSLLSEICRRVGASSER